MSPEEKANSKYSRSQSILPVVSALALPLSVCVLPLSTHSLVSPFSYSNFPILYDNGSVFVSVTGPLDNV